MKSITLTDLLKQHGTEDKAREFFENLRWAGKPKCPRCQSDRIHKIAQNPAKKVRAGLYFCGGCRKQFTVTVGTIMESSHIKLVTWLTAFFIISASKKSVSSLQLQRMLGVTYKTAWFLSHRIRHAMDENPKIGKLYGTVEVDETFVGGKPRNPIPGKLGPSGKKTPVFGLVERDGRIKAMPVPNVMSKTLIPLLNENVEKSSHVMTDEGRSYVNLRYTFSAHEAVKHARREFVRGDAHTNTIESFWALLKRGIHGTYHSVSRKHLHRYVNEYAFRWNNRKVTDEVRMNNAIGAIVGKRLMYN